MIVFTVTNVESDRVFVASSRNAPEERWEQLVAQANEGSEGDIFDEIRRYDPDVFNVEEWGFGEDPKEIRQLMREAQHDLGATVVNTGRVDGLPPAKRKKLSDAAATKLLEEIERSLANDADDDLIPTPSRSLNDSADEVIDSDEEAELDTTSSNNSTSSFTTTDTSKTSEALKTTGASKPVHQDRTESLIEQLARKVEREKVAANAQKLVNAKKIASLNKSSTLAKADENSKIVKEKLPTGRASSRAQEQKIKEGIDKAREDRAQAKHAAERREAVQMSKVIASIELRRKTKKPVKPKAKAAPKKIAKATEAKAVFETEIQNPGPLETAISQAKSTQTVSTTQQEITPERPIEPLFDRAMAIRSAKALNEIIRVQRAQTYKPKAPVKPKVSASILSVKDKRLQQMIDKENAMLLAKKAAMSSASAGEMADVMARIDSRSQETNGTLRRR